MKSSGSSVAVAILLLLIAIVSIQAGAAVAKGLFPVLGSIGISALRLSFASVLLCLAWRPWKHALTRAELPKVLAYGASLGVMNLLFYLALERLPLGLTVGIEFVGPLSVAILASRRAIDLLWAILAIAGIALILPVTPASAEIDPVGVCLALGAGTAWALYIVLGKRAGANTHPGVVTSLGMIVGTCIVLPIGILRHGPQLLNASVLPLVFAVALLSSAVPYSLEMIALKTLPARNFGILMSLEPVVAALIGLWSLGEHLTPLQWTAIGCIMAASIGSSAGIHTETPAT